MSQLGLVTAAGSARRVRARWTLVAVIAMVASLTAFAPQASAATTVTLSGVVQDGSGNPIAGAAVGIYTVGTTTEIAAATTDASGDYSLPVAPASYDVVVTPPAGSGYHSATFGDYPINVPTTLDVVLTNAAAVSWSGSLVTSSGVAIPAAQITLSGASNHTATTTSTGGFSFSLAPGTYKIEVSSYQGSGADYPTYFDAYQGSITIGGELTQNITIPVDKVVVSVQDPSGSPVAGATINYGGNGYYYADNFAFTPGGSATTLVYVSSLNVTTGSDGTATFALIPSSTNNITLQATPPAADTTLASAGLPNLSITSDTNLMINLPQAVTWSGSVVTSKGVAIPGASIYLTGASSRATTADSTGAFSFKIAPGTYNIRVANYQGSGADYPTYFEAYQGSITVGGDLAQNITIPVDQVVLSVRDPSGSPVAGATINYGGNGYYYADNFAFTPGGGATGLVYVSALDVTTGSDGTATFALIPSSTSNITLEATPPAADTNLTSAGLPNLSITSDTNLTIDLPQAVTWSGSLVTSKGVAIPAASISLTGASNHTATTTSTGGFSFNLAPGTYKIEVSNYQGSGADYPSYFVAYQGSITISSDISQSITIPVDQVVLSVRDPSGSPVAGATINYGGNGYYYADNFAFTPGGGATDLVYVHSLDVTTGSDGTATFALIPSSTNNITLEATPPAADTTFTSVGVDNVSVTTDPTDIAVLIQSTDTVPPVIQPVLSTAPNTSGWVNQSVTVSFQCSDSGSGVATCSSPVTESTDGIYTVTGTAEDHAGNISTVTQTVMVDTTAPVVTPSVASSTTQGPAQNGWFNHDVTVDWSCSDPVVNGASSGVATCPSPTTVSTEGADQTVSAAATDNAGNQGTGTATGISIDKTPPSITAPALPAPGGANGWYTKPLTLAFSCSDALSGVASCPTIQVNSGAGQTITGTAFDRAGNEASASVGGLNVDTIPPTVGVSLSSAAPRTSFGWFNHPVTVDFTCSDAISGIASCPAPQTISASGAGQTVTATAVNNAGLKTTVTATVNLDQSPPTITASVSSAPNSQGWYDQPVGISFSCADSLSGVATCSPATTLSSDGAGQTVTGTATDEAGNVATVTTGPINIDQTPPKDAFTTADGAIVTSLPTGPVVTGTAGDNLSGVDSVDVTFTPLTTGGTKSTVPATLACNTSRTACTWTAAPPLVPGEYQVSVSAQDLAGNPASPPEPITIVVA